MIGHDVLNDLLLLADRELSKAILVDASVVIASTRNLPWLRGGKATIMVSGYLDPADDVCVSTPCIRVRHTDLFRLSSRRPSFYRGLWNHDTL
jgi:hypothetical protein